MLVVKDDISKAKKIGQESNKVPFRACNESKLDGFSHLKTPNGIQFQNHKLNKKFSLKIAETMFFRLIQYQLRSSELP